MRWLSWSRRVRAAAVGLLVTAAWVFAGATLAQAGEGSTGVRLQDVTLTDRVVTLAVDYLNDTADATARSLVLYEGGVEVGRRDVATDDAAGTAVFTARVDAAAAAFDADFVEGGGAHSAHSNSLAIRAADWVPPPPSLNLTQNQVVGALLDASGRANPMARVIQVTLRERSAAAVAVSGGGSFTLPRLTVPYGESSLRVAASNAWGRSDATSYRLWNLGRTPGKSNYVLIDTSEFRLYYVKGRVLRSMNPIATGSPVTPTPTGNFKVGGRQRMGASSPWGVLRMRLIKKTHSGWRTTSYYVHGTNNRYSIGTPASHGCVRMYNRDVKELSRRVSRGTAVLIRR